MIQIRNGTARALIAAALFTGGTAHGALRNAAQAPAGGDSLPGCAVTLDGTAPRMVPCDAGGDGATSCQTRTEVSVSGIGYVSGCGVSCDAGTYACCQQATALKKATCSCQAYPPRGPWTPETP